MQKNFQKYLLFLILFFGFFGVANFSQAASHYIAKDCSNNGDGSSWACAAASGGTGALNDLPAPGTQYDCGFDAATWVKGDTYYIAGSDAAYRHTCIGRNATSSGTITIKKATASDHGSDTGWQTSYGTKQAVLGSLSLDSSMSSGVLIDGVSRTGLRSGYGLKIVGGTGANSVGLTGNSNLTVKYVEITSPNDPIVNNCVDTNVCTQDGIYIVNSSNISILNNWIHDVASPINPTADSDLTISGNVVERNDSVPAYHSEAIAANGDMSNIVIANNIWVDIEGTAFFAFMNGGTKTGVNVYNNVSYYTPESDMTGVGNGWLSCLGDTTCNDFNIVSNTMVDIKEGISARIDLQGIASNWVVKNNLWWCSGSCASASNTSSDQITYDKNWYGGITHNNLESGIIDGGVENPFVSSATYNFNLKEGATPINAGIALGIPFNLDFFGTSRPQGGYWDIGAHEYVSGGDAIAPSAPSSLLVN